MSESNHPDRPTDHAGMVVMSRTECTERLASTPVGRVAFVAAGEVEVLPVNYAWDGHSIVFRTTIGAKLEAAAHHAPITFEIDGWDETTRTGWSVLVKGTGTEVLSEEEASKLFSTGLRPWASATERRRWVRIRPDEVSGRKIV